MAVLTVRDTNGKETCLRVADKPVTIGKRPANTIVLTDPNVSREHCVVFSHEGSYYLRDLNSRNGTFVDGRRVNGDILLRDGAEIRILDCIIAFSAEQPTPATPTKPAVPAEPQAQPQPPERVRRTPVALKKKLHEHVIATLDLKHTDFSKHTQEELRAKTIETARRGLAKLAGEIPPWLKPEDLVKEVVDEAIALGPIEDLLADDEVDEIMVNGWDHIYIEKRGRLYLAAKQFISNDQLLAVIRRILAPIGRRIDESSPMVDARLPDGSRVNAIIPPLSLTGPTLTIRKFSRTPFVVEDLIGRFGSLTRQMAEFMALAVRQRCNICISGGTGSGKTTLLNVLSNCIPTEERIVTIEDAAELKLVQEHIVSLESKPPNIEGKGAIPIRKLVINALRMRPDRIVVGECRGGEALDMLQAMNTGHDGSLTTLHANSPRDALRRLETLVLMAGMELPSRAIREQIASAIHVIIQQARMPDGSRKITRVSEIVGLQGDEFLIEDIYAFDQKGFDQDGKVLGEFRATGCVPEFVKRLRERGVEVPGWLFENGPAETAPAEPALEKAT